MKRSITSLLLALVAVTCVAAQAQRDSENDCAPVSDLGEIAVHAEAPEFIETGLVDGSMERLGGVIRYSDNGKSIARLRQVGQVGQGAGAASSLLERVAVLSGQGHLALVRLLASVTPILNISMAGYSIVELIEGIRAHEAEMERIYDRVSEEFQRDRRVELLAALDNAENTFLVENEDYRWAAVAEVNGALTRARKQLEEDLRILLNAETKLEHMELAASTQVLSMRVCALGTRLRLEISAGRAAVHWLAECVQDNRSFAKRFVRKWLGTNRAFFFHESVDNEYLERYLDLERWLREKRDVLLAVLHDARRRFWNDDAISLLYTGGLNSKLIEDPDYVRMLNFSEVMVENYQRLAGYEQELASQCLANYAEREAMESALLEGHDGYVMLVGAMSADAGEG
ncbi:MAG: hypothetical protein OXG84_17610 [Chloroflexi bacterium]|nr:hypothetical protein [Chloroflexota bacterium]